jgi:nucleoside-diphosphate-sugar epimerase
VSGRPKVLLTGSSGRVGSAIAAALTREYEVAGLDLEAGRYTTHRGSIEDASQVDRAIRGAAAVVHTAALHAPHVGRESNERFRTVNVEGTRILLDAAAHHGIRRFLYTSSTSLYGLALEPLHEAVWVTEELRPEPRDVYDETKLAAETLLQEAAGDALRCTSLRISRCFPEPDHLVATYRLYRGVDLRDVAEAHRLALGRDGPAYEVFNVSARSPFRRDDCAALLADAGAVLRRYYPGIDAAYHSRGWPLPATIDRVYVIDRAERLLGYSPRFNFGTMLPTLESLSSTDAADA